MQIGLVSDALWKIIGPLLPEPPQAELDNRKALTGVLFVLKSGVPWTFLPPEMGCGSGTACRRRLVDWRRAGVWGLVRLILMDKFSGAAWLNWSRANAAGFRERIERHGASPRKRKTGRWRLN